MKAIELKLIAELMKNSRRSDRDLARILGVSQPTVTRTRTSLEKQGLIYYTAIPDFPKLGYELLLLTLNKHEKPVHPNDAEDIEMVKKYQEMNPTYILGLNGEGVGYDRIGISIHKNYTEYTKYLERNRVFWNHRESTDSFIVDMKNQIMLQPFSFKTLADNISRDATSIESKRSHQKAASTKKSKTVSN